MSKKEEIAKRDALIIKDINSIGQITFESIHGVEKKCSIIGSWVWYETNIKRGTYTEVSRMHGLAIDRIRQMYQKHLRKTIFRVKKNGTEYGKDFFYSPDMELK